MPSFLADLRSVLAVLPPRLRAGWIALLPVSGVAAVAEAGAAAAVFALVGTLERPADPGRLPLIGPALGLAERLGVSPVAAAASATALLFLAKNGVLAVQVVLRSRVAHRSQAELGKRLFATYLAAPYRVHQESRSGTRIDRITQGVDRVVRYVLESLAALGAEVLVLLGLGVALWRLAPGPALGAGGALAVLGVVGLRLARARMILWGARTRERESERQSFLQQAFDGFEVVQVMGLEPALRDRFDERQDAVEEVRERFSAASAWPRLAIEVAFVLGALGLVALLAGRTERFLPLLGLFAYAGFRIIPSAGRVTLWLQNVWYGRGAVGELAGDLAAPWAARAGRSPAGEDHRPPARLGLRRSLALEGIHAGYGAGRVAVLRGVDLAVARGEALCVAGPTGAGKSTLVGVVLGLLPVHSGRIVVDGVRLAPGSWAAWRRSLGYVPQRTFILDDTLRANVALGLAEAEIDGARVRAVLRQACLEELVAALPRGLDTRLGERGLRLSGGERQRVAIARALYRRPELLVLDEATAALDPATEERLLARLREGEDPPALLVVAHRPSVMRRCDRVALLREGRIEAEGPYEELLERGRELRRLLA